MLENKDIKCVSCDKQISDFDANLEKMHCYCPDCDVHMQIQIKTVRKEQRYVTVLFDIFSSIDKGF